MPTVFNAVVEPLVRVRAKWLHVEFLPSISVLFGSGMSLEIYMYIYQVGGSN